jgi:peptidoglycan/LPS O-acetylase OafA/YrhL
MLDVGSLGVRVFFVLSGFLITTLLFGELQKYGRISLPRFYYRRTLRIFPAFYCFLLVLLAVNTFGWLRIPFGNIVPALLYVSDYADSGNFTLEHAWSLAVEEQFYLLWPAVLLIAGRRKSLTLAAVVILACPVIRLVELILLYRHDTGSLIVRFDAQADALAMGCLLAGLRLWLPEQPHYTRMLHSRMFPLVPVGVLVCQMLLTHGGPALYALDVLFGFTAMNLGVALCLAWVMQFDAGAVGRCLNARPLVTIGVLSYSIYIWQQIFLAATTGSKLEHLPVVVSVTLVFVMALASYVLVERPFLSLRNHFEPHLFGRRDGEESSGR